MIRGYVLIEIADESVEDFVDSVSKRKGALEVSQLFGQYDAIAILEAEDVKKLGDMIAEEVQSQPGVVRTITCLQAPSTNGSKAGRR